MPPAGSRRRGRRARRIVISLVVLLALLVGADFGLAAYAEHTVSQKAREQLKLSDDPSVTIHGFPFTTQAIGGDYGHISLSASGVPIKDLQDVGVTADLYDVTAPLSDLVNGNTDAIDIGRLEAQVTIKASDINKVDPLTKVDDLRIEPSSIEYVETGQDADSGTDSGSGGDQQGQDGTTEEEQDKSRAGIRISGYVQIAGQQLEIFCFAMIELHGTAIDIVPKRLQYGNDKETTVVPEAVQQALLPNFKATIDTGNLPFEVTPTAVQVNSGSVTIKGEAKNVTFSGATSSTGG
ncbi:LmeA family phospholipid-binding protein [Amycolatopsis tucumanensis]|uniref:LmeA family phospholipid-binding protein n=1 Tax=Amycolatopsis tucumanensis TaxID=401106 RepID=UPI003D764E31